MPTVFELFGIRYFFYAGDHEPIHIHLENADGNAKVYLEPELKVDFNHGIKAKDMKKALAMIETYKEEITEAWSRHH